MPDNSIESKVDSAGQVDPKEAALVEKSIKGKEQGPKTVDQTGTFVDWQAMRDELGSPFDAERIPLRKLRQMRRDPMIAFGLHYRKIPLVRAQYHFEARDKNGPNAQVAAFIDSCWRRIHATYMFQHTMDFDFGSAQIIKRFATGNPGGVWEDDSEVDPSKRLKPVWDEGTVLPVIWKPFVNVPLEKVAPVFEKTSGDFNGMIYDSSASAAAPISAPQDNKLTDTQTYIDVYHSVWGTNDKASVWGNIYGFPLIAHAYRYWWSYWFRWAMADRAFERLAIPPLVARHPEGNHIDEISGEERPYSEIAAEAAQGLRSNSIATVPSTLQTAGIDEQGSNTPMWDFAYMESSGVNFDFLDKSFNYLDVMKMRSIWVPEQAFMEGEGGTSSRNVATQMYEIFMESQANKWEEIADHINRYILPQLLLVDFPEFVNNGGTVRIVGHGFDSQDIELMKQLIQLVGQQGGLEDVDVRTGLERMGVPLKTPEQLARDQVALVNQQQAGNAQVPAVNGITRGTTQGAIAAASAGNPGGNNGGSVPSVTGFSDDDPVYVYVQPREIIELADHDDFLNNLPDSAHYYDKSMRAIALQIRKLFMGHFRQLYPDFAKYVAGVRTIVLEDPVDETMVFEFADRDITKKGALKAANRMLDDWAINSQRMERLTEAARKLLMRGLKRALTVAGKEIKPSEVAPEEELVDYVNNKTGVLIKGIHKTMKNELRDFLVNEILEGNSAEDIGQHITEHFDGFEEFKADRIARSEIRDVMNAGSLFNAEAAKLKYVQATDGTDFDVDCRNRNGKLFTIREAWKEMSHARTHPNCTLGFKPVPRADFSIQHVNKLPDNAPDKNDLAWFDDAHSIAYVPMNLSDELASEFLAEVATHVIGVNGSHRPEHTHA